MEEEIVYSTVACRNNDGFPGVIKDVINKEPSGNHENRSTLPVMISAAMFGLLTLLLLFIIIYLVLNARGSDGEFEREIENLRRERDALNWTLNVITDMEVFPVKEYCTKKVCKPCQAGWMWFGSSCYYFSHEWKWWDYSQAFCQGVQAQLLIIQTQEEQEFIVNQTTIDRGYWIGARITEGRWTWEDGSNFTTYWVDGSAPNYGCIRIFKKTGSLASWSFYTCTWNQRFICEKPALTRTF